MDMMDMDLEDEESADKQDSHHCGRTQLSINTPTSTNIVVTAPSPSQEGFVEGGGFGRGSKSVIHPTLSPRFPVGAGPNTCGDPGVGQSRLPEWCGRDETPQAEAAEAASTAIAAGKVRSRKECGDCGSVIGRWGAVVPSGLSQERSNRALSGKSCESCGGYVVVERESKGRMQDWSKTSSTLTTPSASETTVQRTLERGSDNGGAEGKGDDQRRTPSGTTAIAFPVNEDGGSRGDRADDGDHSGLVHSAKRVSQEARLASVGEDERQAGRTKQRKRGREEEDSAPATPLSSARSSLAHRRRGNDLIARMPRLSWGQSGDDSSAHTARRASNGSVGGGGGGGGGGVMTATPVDTRSDPPSDPVSKRRKSDHSHGDSSPFKSSVMVAARSKYRIVQHRGFSESGEMVGGSSGCADSAATGSLDEPIVTGASRQTTYSPGISKSSSSSNRRHDSRSIDTNSAYRRRYRDECSINTKNTPRRRQGTAPSPLHKRSPEATGTCAAPRTPTSTVAVQGADSTVDPAVPVLVVIDGSNVAFSFRQDVSNPRWSPQGILLALKFFQERGVPVVAFVPRPRVDSIAPGSEDYDAFMEAMRSQAIATVPSKANDDLFILLYAIQRSAHIVTNDQFRDHLANASTLDSLGLTKDELRTFLLQHHVSYTFARDEFVANPEAAIIRMLTKQTASIGSEVRRTGPRTT